MRRGPPTFAEFFAGETIVAPFRRTAMAVTTAALALRARVENPSPVVAEHPFAVLKGTGRVDERYAQARSRGLVATKARYERTVRLADLDVTLLEDGRLVPFKRRGARTASRLAPATLPEDEEPVWFVGGLAGRAAYEAALTDLALVEDAGCEGFLTRSARGADWALVERRGFREEREIGTLRGIVDHLVAVFHPVGWEAEVATRIDPVADSATLRAARRRTVVAPARQRLETLLAATGAPEGLLEETFPTARARP